MKSDSSLRRFAHPGQGEPKPVGCHAQRSPAVARNYEEVRCGSVVRKNCQDGKTAHLRSFWHRLGCVERGNPLAWALLVQGVRTV